MTGFGASSIQSGGVHYNVEVRSVNNRFLKATLRLPDNLSVLEGELEQVLRNKLARGSVTLTVAIKDDTISGASAINASVLAGYLDQLKIVRTQVGDNGIFRVELGALLSLPGVVDEPEQGALLERYLPSLKKLVEEACDRVIAMRQEEGRKLHEELLVYLSRILTLVDKVGLRAPQVIDQYHIKLRNRVKEMIAKAELHLNEVDLIKEVAVYAERCDISEEIQRLKAHVSEFERILTEDNGDATGRTLDFLAQELLREANTIASKSNDAEISHMIVEVKGAIDKIKEQAQNVE